MAYRLNPSRLLSRSSKSQAAILNTSAVALGLITTISLTRDIHAEEPPSASTPIPPHHPNRKPIYDETLSLSPPSVVSASPSTSTPDTPQPTSTRTTPTPTDRLASQIRHLRLSLHSSAVRTEDLLDAKLTEGLSLERSFASTLASLHPPASSGERLLPGSIYVLVAAMAGSIITRNRNILLRFSVPLAVGVGAAKVVLPLTMQNVGDLVWEYEKRYPVVADTHVRVTERVRKVWETGKAHTMMSVGMVEDKVGEVREGVEGWVKKGK